MKKEEQRTEAINGLKMYGELLRFIWPYVALTAVCTLLLLTA